MQNFLTLPIAAAISVLLAWSVIWAFGDAEQRGRSPWKVALLVLLTWPVGLLVWLAIRPSILVKAYARTRRPIR